MAGHVDYLGVLKTAITLAHKCQPIHRGTILVKETAGGNETLWEGPVELFGLSGHKKAKTCYAWQHIDAEGRTRIFSVLKNRYIGSARAAVHATICRNLQPVPIDHRRELKLLKKRLSESSRLFREAQITAEGLTAIFRSLIQQASGKRKRRAGKLRDRRN